VDDFSLRYFFILFMILLVSCSNEAPLTVFDFSEVQMGVDFKLRIYAENESIARTAAGKAFARIAELDAICSDYKVDSELWQINEKAGLGVPYKISTDLTYLLDKARYFSQISNGAFDITAGPYVLLWRQARAKKSIPAERSMLRAANKVGMQKVEIDTEQNLVTLKAEKMRLDLGAIAKGYAADEALKVLLREGAKYALVDGSGDMAMSESPEGHWQVFIANSESEATEYVELRAGSIATSGDATQYVELDGVRYSHIVDPRTGMGVVGSSLVTVIAQDGMSADALASAVSVMGPEEGIALIETIPNVEVCVQSMQNGKLYKASSSGFPVVKVRR
jgi:FAD:protein FMN transferase